MPSFKGRLETSAKWIFVIGAALSGGSGITAGDLQAAPEHPAIAALQVEVSINRLLGCGLEGRGAQRFVVKQAGGETRTMDICSTEPHGDLAATAQALSLAIDAAATQPFRITSDPRTVDLVGLRLMRARTEVDPTMDTDARSRKLAEIDDSIKAIEDALSRER